MKRLVLVRLTVSPRTFGVLMDESADGLVPFCVTLERPWLNNQRSISCIPAGSYICRRVKSPKFGDTFEVTSVPGRSEILLHKGNLLADTHGCIILGEKFDPLKGEDAVLSSGEAFDEFMGKMVGLDEFHFTVKEFVI